MGDNTRTIVGIVMIAVAFIVFPIILTGAGTIIDWTGTDNATISTFTGLESMVKIGPLLVFIGLLVGGGILTFTGIRGRVTTRGKR